MNVLHCRAASHSYNHLTVLSGIDLTVQPGEVTALLGPSGCGKTTLLRLAAGLLQPTSGRIDRPAAVGMAFQEPRLLPWLNCLDNVLFGLARRQPGDADRARAILDGLGLAGYENFYPRALSGGMAQRVSLARALLARPELLLLDEPLSGMDYFGRTDLEERLARLWQAERPAVLLVTHDPDEVVFLADHVLILSARPGRILDEVELAVPRPRKRLGPEMGEARARVLAALAAARETDVSSIEKEGSFAAKRHIKGTIGQ